MDKNKVALYKELVNDVRDSYLKQKGTATFQWCDECKEEINLWTYWQGRGNLDPEILLVGRDWGNPLLPEGQSCMGYIDAINPGKTPDDIPPYLGQSKFPTDHRVAKLFHDALDIDVSRPNEKVFFTNFVLGYSVATNSEKPIAEQLFHDEDFFRRLVRILQPRVIICLGQDVFKGVSKAYGFKLPYKEGFKKDLDKGNNFIEYNGMKLFAVAHPGNLGCNNRVKGDDDTSREASMKKQKEDWRRIREALDQF